MQYATYKRHAFAMRAHMRTVQRVFYNHYYYGILFTSKLVAFTYCDFMSERRKLSAHQNEGCKEKKNSDDDDDDDIDTQHIRCFIHNTPIELLF